LAALARIRSLLIMIDDDNTSRRCRAMLHALSLRYPERPHACSALITVEIAISEAFTFSRFIVLWNSSDSRCSPSEARLSYLCSADAIIPLSARSDALARVKCAAPGGS